MPKFVVAHRSGAHRLAATALYRVLIAQCKKLDASQQRQQQLHNLIRCRFSTFRHTTSHRELKLLFEAGYEAVDHLDAVLAGERKSAQYVWGLLDRAPRQAKERPSAVVQRRSISEEYNDPFKTDVLVHRVPEEPSTTGHGHAVETSATLRPDTDRAPEASHDTALHDGTTPVVSKDVLAVSEVAVSADAHLLEVHPMSAAVDGAAEPSHEATAQDQSRPAFGQYTSGAAFRKVFPSVTTGGAAEASHDTAPRDETTPVITKELPGYWTYTMSPAADRAAEPRHERRSIFERAVPREELGGTGRRQVPKIFSANTIPVLRFVKPQPPALTGFLNSRIKQRQRRHDLRHVLEEQLPVAAQEDQWDAILREHAGIGSGGGHQRGTEPVTREVRWSSEVRESLKQVNSYLDQEKAKNRSMAEKMYAVIDREAKLVEQERSDDEKEQTGTDGMFDEEPEGLSDMVSEIIGHSDGARRPHG